MFDVVFQYEYNNLKNYFSDKIDYEYYEICVIDIFQFCDKVYTYNLVWKLSAFQK